MTQAAKLVATLTLVIAATLPRAVRAQTQEASPASGVAPLTPSSPPPPAPPPPPPAVRPPPPTAAPQPPGTAPTDEVRFAPDDPSLTLLRRAGERPVTRVIAAPYAWGYERELAPVYSPLCTGPCRARFAPGVYQLALAKYGRAIPAPPVAIDGPSVLHGEYTDHGAVRVTGLIIGIAGTVGGVVMMSVSYHHEIVCDPTGFCYSQGVVNAPLMTGGVAVLVGSIVAGSIMLSQRDQALITVMPLSLPAVGATRESPLAALAAAPPPQGAGLRVRF